MAARAPAAGRGSGTGWAGAGGCRTCTTPASVAGSSLARTRGGQAQGQKERVSAHGVLAGWAGPGGGGGEQGMHHREMPRGRRRGRRCGSPVLTTRAFGWRPAGKRGRGTSSVRASSARQSARQCLVARQVVCRIPARRPADTATQWAQAPQLSTFCAAASPTSCLAGREGCGAAAGLAAQDCGSTGVQGGMSVTPHPPLRRSCYAPVGGGHRLCHSQTVQSIHALPPSAPPCTQSPRRQGAGTGSARGGGASGWQLEAGAVGGPCRRCPSRRLPWPCGGHPSHPSRGS